MLIRGMPGVLSSLLLVLILAVTGLPSPAAAAAGPDAPIAPLREGIYLNLPAFRLTLYRGGQPIRSYPVAIGKAGYYSSREGRKSTQTPTGVFSIVSKDPRPSWEPPAWLKREKGWPTGYSVPAGSQANPLGKRWLSLSIPAYGIHGNNDPASIGQAISLGCIRMRNEDIVELFELVRVGLPVEIVYRTSDIVIEPETGTPQLFIYSDVYHRGPATVESLQETFRRAGLAPLNGDRLKALLAAAKTGPVREPLVVQAAETPASPVGSAAAAEFAGIVISPEVSWRDDQAYLTLDDLAGSPLGSRLRQKDGRLLFYGQPLAGAVTEEEVTLIPVESLARAIGYRTLWRGGDLLTVVP